MSINLTGEKLRTYDPDHPEWSSNTAEQDSALDRNYMGFLIERPGSKATKQLVVINGGNDPQEQSGHKVARYIAQELLSGSRLSLRLMRRFSFLFVPMTAQQGIRDGFSRFTYDCPLPGVTDNLNANGGSVIGWQVIQQAMANWASDHPTPAAAVFCVGSFHCDDMNQNLTSKRGSGSVEPDYSTPTAPYGTLAFPDHITDADMGISVFRDTATGGFDSVAWPEFLKAGNILPNTTSGLSGAIGFSAYSATEWYFEMPWRHPGNKASFFYRTDAHQNFAIGFLSGLATVAGANVPLDDTAISAGSHLTTSFSKRATFSTAVSLGAAVTTGVTFTRYMPTAVRGGARVATTLARTAFLQSNAVQGGARVATTLCRGALVAAATCTSAVTLSAAVAGRSAVSVSAATCTSAATLSAATATRGIRVSAATCTSAASLSAAQVARTSGSTSAQVCTSAATTAAVTSIAGRRVSGRTCTSVATTAAVNYQSAANPNYRNQYAVTCTSAATLEAAQVSRGVRVSARPCTAVATVVAMSSGAGGAYYSRVISGRMH